MRRAIRRDQESCLRSGAQRIPPANAIDSNRLLEYSVPVRDTSDTIRIDRLRSNTASIQPTRTYAYRVRLAANELVHHRCERTSRNFNFARRIICRTSRPFRTQLRRALSFGTAGGRDSCAYRVQICLHGSAFLLLSSPFTSATSFSPRALVFVQRIT